VGLQPGQISATSIKNQIIFNNRKTDNGLQISYPKNHRS
jgi:hypothetical protein